jgi:hypothetical protein
MQLEAIKQLQDTDEVETLRLILESQQGRDISRDEALEVGESLLCYFKTLANEDDTSDLGLEDQ